MAFLSKIQKSEVLPREEGACWWYIDVGGSLMDSSTSGERLSVVAPGQEAV